MGESALMIAMKHNLSLLQGTSDLTVRGLIFALVVSVHAAVFSVWIMQPDAALHMQHDLSVSFSMVMPALQSAPPRPATLQSVTPPQQKPAPVTEPVTEQAAVAAEAMPSVAQPQAAAVAAPAAIDTQPDYKASYLNNPPPSYPAIARRNGLQGRVVLNVEVLANGSSGKVTVQSSSGYAILDNAALQTVKTWRFVPARHGGQVVDKWFLIPIQFSLKDNQV
jgi:periplasmic protein TonB